MSTHGRRRLAAFGLVCSFAACDLEEVTVPNGDDILIVEAVLRAGEPEQYVMLHRTIDGPGVRGEPGAEVVVRSESGDTLAFAQGSATDCVPADTLPDGAEPSCYVAENVSPGWIEPGGEYELHVRTSRGEHAFGRTIVPDDFEMIGLPSGARDRASYHCALPPGRSVDLLWTASANAEAYLSQLDATGLRDALADTGIPDIPEPLTLTGVSISSTDTTINLPSAYGVEERFDLDQDLMRAVRDGFPEGVRLAVVVAAVEKNLADSYREAFSLTGTVRGPSVTGDGTGLFGSMVPKWLDIEVAENTAGASCITDRSE